MGNRSYFFVLIFISLIIIICLKFYEFYKFYESRIENFECDDPNFKANIEYISDLINLRTIEYGLAYNIQNEEEQKFKSGISAGTSAFWNDLKNLILNNVFNNRSKLNYNVASLSDNRSWNQIHLVRKLIQMFYTFKDIAKNHSSFTGNLDKRWMDFYLYKTYEIPRASPIYGPIQYAYDRSDYEIDMDHYNPFQLSKYFHTFYPMGQTNLQDAQYAFTPWRPNRQEQGQHTVRLYGQWYDALSKNPTSNHEKLFVTKLINNKEYFVLRPRGYKHTNSTNDISYTMYTQWTCKIYTYEMIGLGYDHTKDDDIESYFLATTRRSDYSNDLRTQKFIDTWCTGGAASANCDRIEYFHNDQINRKGKKQYFFHTRKYISIMTERDINMKLKNKFCDSTCDANHLYEQTQQDELLTRYQGYLYVSLHRDKVKEPHSVEEEKKIHNEAFNRENRRSEWERICNNYPHWTGDEMRDNLNTKTGKVENLCKFKCLSDVGLSRKYERTSTKFECINYKKDHYWTISSACSKDQDESNDPSPRSSKYNEFILTNYHYDSATSEHAVSLFPDKDILDYPVSKSVSDRKIRLEPYGNDTNPLNPDKLKDLQTSQNYDANNTFLFLDRVQKVPCSDRFGQCSEFLSARKFSFCRKKFCFIYNTRVGKFLKFDKAHYIKTDRDRNTSTKGIELRVLKYVDDSDDASLFYIEFINLTPSERKTEIAIGAPEQQPNALEIELDYIPKNIHYGNVYSDCVDIEI